MKIWPWMSNSSVAEIIDPLKDMVLDLDKHRVSKLKEADALEAEAFRLQEDASAAQNEAHRAGEISKILKEILSNE